MTKKKPTNATTTTMAPKLCRCCLLLAVFLLTFSLFLTKATTVTASATTTPSAFVSSQQQHRRRSRRLEDYKYSYNGNNNYFGYDLTRFSLSFDKCQAVKMYDDEMAEDEDADTVLSTRSFVVFSLCPTATTSETEEMNDNYYGYASSSSSSLLPATCNADACEAGVHGLYAVDLYTYLEAAVPFQERVLENTCRECDEACGNDDDDDEEEEGDEEGEDGDDDNNKGGNANDLADCYGQCGPYCYEYATWEDNGYVDASEYLECQRLEKNINDGDEEEGEEGEDQDDDDEVEYYIGPKCTQDGTQIELALFYDEDCGEPVQSSDNLDLETLLGAPVFDLLLRQTYTNLRNTDSDNADDDNNYDEKEHACWTCREEENEEDNNENDRNDADEVNEMCEELYDAAAKCESKFGLEQGFVQVARNGGNNNNNNNNNNNGGGGGDYENQVQNEFMACTFIQSLVWNSYDETGEINFDAVQDVVNRVVTRRQAVTLSVMVVVGCVLFGILYYYQQKIDALTGGSTGGAAGASNAAATASSGNGNNSGNKPLMSSSGVMT